MENIQSESEIKTQPRRKRSVRLFFLVGALATITLYFLISNSLDDFSFGDISFGTPKEDSRPRVPNRQHILGYLDGYELFFSDVGGVKGETSKSVIIKKEQIRSLRVITDDDSNDATVSFLAKTPQGTYAIRLFVNTHSTDNTFVFTGIQPSQITRR